MNENLVEAIRGLANSPAIQKSKVARIRELLPDIEHAQQAGVRLADISTFLGANGFEKMNLRCLQNLLFQARKGKGREGRKPKSKSDAVPIHPKRKTTSAGGIDAESILADARKSMQSSNASSLTLGLLRSPKSTSTERNTK